MELLGCQTVPDAFTKSSRDFLYNETALLETAPHLETLVTVVYETNDGNRRSYKNGLDEQLLEACLAGQEDLVKWFLEMGANANTVDMVTLVTPLIAASRNGHASVVCILCKHGADLKSRDAHGMTALAHAVQGQFSAVVRVLCECGVDINVRVRGGLTVLHFAVMLADLDIARMLINAGASTCVKTPIWKAVQKFAELQGHVDILRYVRGATREKERPRSAIATFTQLNYGKAYQVPKYNQLYPRSYGYVNQYLIPIYVRDSLRSSSSSTHLKKVYPEAGSDGTDQYDDISESQVEDSGTDHGMSYYELIDDSCNIYQNTPGLPTTDSPSNTDETYPQTPPSSQPCLEENCHVRRERRGHGAPARRERNYEMTSTLTSRDFTTQESKPRQHMRTSQCAIRKKTNRSQGLRKAKAASKNPSYTSRSSESNRCVNTTTCHDGKEESRPTLANDSRLSGSQQFRQPFSVENKVWQHNGESEHPEQTRRSSHPATTYKKNKSRSPQTPAANSDRRPYSVCETIRPSKDTSATETRPPDTGKMSSKLLSTMTSDQTAELTRESSRAENGRPVVPYRLSQRTADRQSTQLYKEEAQPQVVNHHYNIIQHNYPRDVKPRPGPSMIGGNLNKIEKATNLVVDGTLNSRNGGGVVPREESDSTPGESSPTSSVEDYLTPCHTACEELFV